MRVMVVADNRVFRETLSELLAARESLDIVGQAGSGATAVRLAMSTFPDLVVLDGGPGGRITTPAIRHAVPGARVILLATRADLGCADQMAFTGAHAILAPGAGEAELLAVVRRLRG